MAPGTGSRLRAAAIPVARVRVLAATGVASIADGGPAAVFGVPGAAISGADPKALGTPRPFAGPVCNGREDHFGAH